MSFTTNYNVAEMNEYGKLLRFGKSLSNSSLYLMTSDTKNQRSGVCNQWKNHQPNQKKKKSKLFF